ncbi:hypothetical protein B0H10DRAFT_2203183 [Mycena sp. CBHHK59/15]|nr:hypothetical protein B0H10DRAFT_2203183 [Mycena sp. CBHHK59/15]
MGWDRGSREEYDAWETVTEKDASWNWDSLLPFFKKSEDAAAASVNWDSAVEHSRSEADVIKPGLLSRDVVGTGGPLKTSYNMVFTDVIPPFVKAWNSLGQPTNSNPFGGDSSGVYNVRRSIDHESGKRITSASAYYTPVSMRSNLKVLTGVQVCLSSMQGSVHAQRRQASKILFKPELVDGNRIAIGVEFSAEGKVFSVSASKKIILSAGVIGTPHLLEISGIGDAKRLQDIGIETLVDLPGVGENLHDHVFTRIHYLAKHGIRTYATRLDELKNNPEFNALEQERYDKTGQGWMASNDGTVAFTAMNQVIQETILSDKIQEIENDIAIEKDKGSLSKLKMQQYAIQLDWLKQGSVPHIEFIRVVRVPQGSVAESSAQLHTQSKDPSQQPRIDPQYLTHEFGFRAIEKLAQTPPLADIIAKQVAPATPLSDEEVMQYIRQVCSSGAHYMGEFAPLLSSRTAAMARRDLGGVVGNDLRVYGTANLRVADASITPLPLACHIQATVYAIGEKGFHPSGFATGRRAVTTGRDPSVQYFSVRFRRPGTGRVDPSTGHPLPVRRRVDGSTKDRVNQRRDDGVLWCIGKAAITAGFPSIRQDEFQLWE